MSAGSTFLYPNVTSIPGKNDLPQSEQRVSKEQLQNSEFGKIFDQTVGHQLQPVDLNQIRQPLKFSAHATQRIQDRKIGMDSAMSAKINEAVDRAAAKGLDDTLILAGDAAFIVSAKNRTVVTALDRNTMSGNVFTNIDGAIIV